MEKQLNYEATEYVNKMKRIQDITTASEYKSDVLFLPDGVELKVYDDSNVSTIGLDTSRDSKAKDMLRVIEVKDAFLVDYQELNVLSPSVYVHSLEDIPWHITTQGFLITKIDNEIKNYIKNECKQMRNHYGRHEMDEFWLPCSKNVDSVSPEETICIFNRRVSGWDGSKNRPVIELLGAGGHLQARWDSQDSEFKSLTLIENLKKEFSEEIGLIIKEDDIKQIGGFVNIKTHELVVFFCIYIQADLIPTIQEYALNNDEEDTDGIYLGTFNETMNYYIHSPHFFAGGERAAGTNFPNNKKIMAQIRKQFNIK